mmetsp:Transcript_1624/g.2495  ORF Transcript_1624/g.2495 Transcript_1624/m.2495 type:complete len:88 (-) Transcript_1624:14-277(-)
MYMHRNPPDVVHDQNGKETNPYLCDLLDDTSRNGRNEKNIKEDGSVSPYHQKIRQRSFSGTACTVVVAAQQLFRFTVSARKSLLPVE